jgi:hypothetical protein
MRTFIPSDGKRFTKAMTQAGWTVAASRGNMRLFWKHKSGMVVDERSAWRGFIDRGELPNKEGQIPLLLVRRT